jgi:hypothetical protein
MKNILFCLTILIYINLSTACLKANAETQPRDKEFLFKSDTLIKVCLQYIHSKDYKSAEKALGSAYKIAKEIKEPYAREIIFNEIVNEYILIGELGNALRVAESMGFSDVQSEALINIAYKAVGQSAFSLATKITKQIKDPFSKAKAFYKIIKRLTELELYDRAIKFAQETEESQIFIEEFLSAEFLARKLLEEDYVLAVDQGSVNLSLRPDELCRRSKELALVANQYLDLYLFGLAKKILGKANALAAKIDSPSLKRDVLKRIAAVDIKRIKLEKAFKIQ